jgi:hypothetical protein
MKQKYYERPRLGTSSIHFHFISRMKKPRRMNEMAGAFSTHGETKSTYNILIGNLKRRDQLEDLAID